MIPANDDAIRSIELMVKGVAGAIENARQKSAEEAAMAEAEEAAEEEGDEAGQDESSEG